MFQEQPREREWHSWLFFVSWSLIIIRLAPLTRPFLLALTNATSRDVLVYVTIGMTICAGLVGALYVIRHPRLRSLPSVITLAGVVAAYIWICLHELQAPQEALHFLEYGFLGLLAFRALSHRLRDIAIYPTAILLCGLVGNADEIMQWLTPDRFWDLRDWGWDMAAAALAQVAIAGGMRPPLITGRPQQRSLRFLLRSLAAQILLMGLCLSATPARCVQLGALFPGLNFLTWHEKVMTEYGYLHRDFEIGSFYSRFTLDELKQMDSARHEEVGAIIKFYRDGPGYKVFIREINSGVDAFTHEAYVHIYRRDHNMMSTYDYLGKNAAEYAARCRIAIRENQIVEKYYPQSARAAGEMMTLFQVDRLSRGMVEKRPYTSAVSAHLITRFTEGQMQLIFAFALFLVIALDLKLSSHA